VDTLHLTVSYGTHEVEYETACEEFTWHDTTYRTSGTYTFAYINAEGCSSVDTLYLTVNPSYNIIVYDTAIREHEFTFGDFVITPPDSGTYTYDFTFSTVNGCDSIVHLILYVQYNDGIEPHVLSNVEVYPNPAHSLLYIKGEEMSQIMIYNADGQLVYSTTEPVNNLHSVDVSRYATGNYFVKIVFGNKQTLTKKVIVSRK
jgi:hypothetical protein